jgi:hypothetical protein
MDNSHSRRAPYSRWLAWCAVVLLLSSCAPSRLILLPREGGEAVTGTMSVGGELAVTLLGRDYHGKYYATDGGVSTGTYTSYGRRFRTGSYQSFTPPRNARALLLAADGNTLRCEFTFGGDGGAGSCTTNDRHEFDLLIKNE